MQYDIVKTNIVNVAADAIVLPANTMLKEGSGASTAIFEAAGRKELTQACKKLGSCEVGNAVPTLAFNLKAKYIIHAVVPKWVDGNNGEYDLLSSAYLSALNIADVMGCESIAFPLLASGNNGFDLELSFEIAKKSIESYEATNLKKANLIIYGNHIASIVKMQGYEMIEIPENIHDLDKKNEHQLRWKKLMNDGKDVAQKFLEDQMEKAIDYLKDEKNREKVLHAGIVIAQTAFAAARKKKR